PPSSRSPTSKCTPSRSTARRSTQNGTTPYSPHPHTNLDATPYAGAAIVVSGQPIGVVCVFGDQPRDFGEGEEQALVALARQASAHLQLRQRNSELRELAVSDPLTGLANRTLLFDRLDMAIAQHHRDGGHVGVLFCDVDDFKQVNDRWGHGAGDRLLCHVAACLSAATRDTDTVSRFAGDEFVVVCPGLGEPQEFQAIIERIDRILHTPGSVEGSPTPPRLSIGAALLKADETAADVLRRADDAMYAIKTTKGSTLAPPNARETVPCRS
ncbi:MAG: sensor domain-containing diguanylate cyclase, partial [Solirubrobacteraceae bacterium]